MHLFLALERNISRQLDIIMHLMCCCPRILSQVSELLPKLEASSELSVQPSLTQLASMAREDAASLAEVLRHAVGGLRCDVLHVFSFKTSALHALRLPILRSSSRVWVVSAGTSPLTFAVCIWTT